MYNEIVMFYPSSCCRPIYFPSIFSLSNQNPINKYWFIHILVIRNALYKTSSIHVKTNSYNISIQYLLLTTRFRYHHNRIHNPSLYVNRQYTYYLRSMKIGYSTLHFSFYLCHVYIFTVWPKEVMIN